MDVLPVCDAMSTDDKRQQTARLDRRVAELAKPGQRGDAIREALGESGVGQLDPIPIPRPIPIRFSWLTPT